MKVVSHRSMAPALDASAQADALEAPGAPAIDAEALAYLSDALIALERAQDDEAGIVVAPQHQLASLLQSYLVEHPRDLTLIDQETEAGTLEVRFDEGDWFGWAKSVLDWWRKIKPEPWKDPPAAPQDLGDGQRLRVALLGDWGTGLYGAPVCANSISADPEKFDLLVHLGDVYYSGTPEEVKENFLAFWPTVDGAVSRAVNSNHEMYSGGEGLFKETLPAFDQDSTCWAIQTDRFLLVGLDSAYKDHDFARDQVTWLRGLLENTGRRKLILFCHHQPYSRLDNQGPKLVDKLGDLLTSGRVFAWYWGHEHRCVLYDRHPRWSLHGRCIGHSGMPYYRDDVTQYPLESDDSPWRRLEPANLVPGGVVLDTPNEFIPSDPDRYGPNGYVTLEIDDDTLTEHVHAPGGEVLRSTALD